MVNTNQRNIAVTECFVADRFVDGVGDDTLIKDETGRVALSLIEHTSDLDKLLSFVFPKLKSDGEASTFSSAVLTLLNKTVDQLNALIMTYLPGPEVELLSHDFIESSNDVGKSICKRISK